MDMEHVREPPSTAGRSETTLLHLSHQSCCHTSGCSNVCSLQRQKSKLESFLLKCFLDAHENRTQYQGALEA